MSHRYFSTLSAVYKLALLLMCEFLCLSSTVPLSLFYTVTTQMYICDVYILLADTPPPPVVSSLFAITVITVAVVTVVLTTSGLHFHAKFFRSCGCVLSGSGNFPLFLRGAKTLKNTLSREGEKRKKRKKEEKKKLCNGSEG